MPHDSHVPDAASQPPTEGMLETSRDLELKTADQVLADFAAQDDATSRAVQQVAKSIVALAEAMHGALTRGGRIVYAGAGTSGRLGVLDAAEWGPTFGLADGRIIALMAGGSEAVFRAVEGAEDRGAEARRALQELALGREDLLVGISASGGAAFVREALVFARERDATRALITTNPQLAIDDEELLFVALDTGAEVLSGSTRLKAASATHMVLQRASNLCAIRSGWVYRGRMVEMRPTNRKLRRRAVGIVAELAELDWESAESLLERAQDDIKVALVMAKKQLTADEAFTQLAAAQRDLREVLHG